MSVRHPFGWDLPTGVTSRDIDGTDEEFARLKLEREIDRADRRRDEEKDRQAELSTLSSNTSV